MMRSMYSGVSGLKAHQTRMDVIGNNIANVNTNGYKKSRVVFADTLYQSMRYGTIPSDVRGGTNPMGVGLGSQVASIDQIHTSAPTTTTNKTTDMACSGNGYFIVKNGNEAFYTRAGAFDWDSTYNLVNSNGYMVQGWMANTDPTRATDTGDFSIDASGATTGINIADYKEIAPRATENVSITGNLNSDYDIPQFTDATPTTDDINPATTGATGEFPAESDDQKIVSFDTYDSLGRKQTVYARFFKTSVTGTAPTATETNWACDLSLNPLFNRATGFAAGTNFGQSVNLRAATVTASTPAAVTLATDKDVARIYNLRFDSDGVVASQSPTAQPWYAQVQLTIDKNTLLTVPVQPTQEALAKDVVCTVDMTKVTQYSGTDNCHFDTQDGYQSGSMVKYSVGTDGTITGVYDNGQTKSIARVAVATFDNPSGLQQVGGTMWQTSVNSGQPIVGQPGIDGKGSIVANALEMSNVDLSEEFTDMIVTERGFQANSRIITTSDEMLQELVNLKR
ncbi:MAG: flagellar hook protein FlgE [Deltaproteobacteria bacterium]